MTQNLYQGQFQLFNNSYDDCFLHYLIKSNVNTFNKLYP